MGSEEVNVVPLKNVEFPEFWRKMKMSFISKTIRDRVILTNVCTLWVLETLDIVPLKKVEFPEFCPHLEFWGKWKMLFISKP